MAVGGTPKGCLTRNGATHAEEISPWPAWFLGSPWQTPLVFLCTVASLSSKSSRMTSLLLLCEKRAKPAADLLCPI